jgi:hypothetical protein
VETVGTALVVEQVETVGTEERPFPRARQFILVIITPTVETVGTALMVEQVETEETVALVNFLAETGDPAKMPMVLARKVGLGVMATV